jgi:hypothetical protein
MPFEAEPRDRLCGGVIALTHVSSNLSFDLPLLTPLPRNVSLFPPSAFATPLSLGNRFVGN